MRKLKEILQERVPDNRNILVVGVGQYTYSHLKQSVLQKLSDIQRRVNEGDTQSLGERNYEVLILMLSTLACAEQDMAEGPPRVKVTIEPSKAEPTDHHTEHE